MACQIRWTPILSDTTRVCLRVAFQNRLKASAECDLRSQADVAGEALLVQESLRQMLLVFQGGTASAAAAPLH